MRDQRLLTSLLVSFTLHMAFFAFVLPLLSRPASALKRPIWVDLVDLKETSPLTQSSQRATRSPEASSKESEREVAKQAFLERKTSETTLTREEPVEPPVPRSRPLPSARDLIPTVNSLLGLQREYENPLYVEPLQDEAWGLHRGPQFDAYLRDVKEAVKGNWRVSGEGESKRGTTVLRISINPDGSLASLDLLQSCGMILHDYEALEAIKQSFPLRPPPTSLLDEHGKLAIRFSFHYLLTPPG